MAYFEIRSGLKKLEFEPLAEADIEARCAVVEFVYDGPLAAGQWARLALGRQNGLMRELVGVPELVSVQNTSTDQREYRYRLRGAIRAAHD